MKILTANGEKYSEEDIKKVRDLLYKFALLEYQNHKKKEANRCKT